MEEITSKNETGQLAKEPTAPASPETPSTQEIPFKPVPEATALIQETPAASQPSTQPTLTPEPSPPGEPLPLEITIPPETVTPPPSQTTQPLETSKIEVPPTATPIQSTTPSPASLKDLMASIRQLKSKKREARLEKILAYARQQGKITNNDIQRLLRVSDATATRYAQALIRRDLLKKSSGRTKGVYYEPL